MQDEVSNSVSEERISIVFMYCPISLPELALEDESLLMVVTLPCSHQLLLRHLQRSRAQIFSFEIQQRCPNELIYNDSLSETTVFKASCNRVVSRFGWGSMIKPSHLKQLKQRFAKGHKNELEIPRTIPNIKCPAKEINNRSAGTMSTIAVSSLSRRCTSTTEYNNIPLSPEAFCDMSPSSMISDDLPPVFHLHKEPIPVSFPAHLSCIISPRPMRSGA